MKNIFLKINSLEMYKAIKMLHENGIIDKCILLVSGRYDMVQDNDWVRVLHEAPICNGNYELYEDSNNWFPIDINVWRRYAYYLGFVSQMGARFHNFPITVFEEQERIFINGIRFWNFIFSKYNIDTFIYLGAIPHEAGIYIGYCVAKERNCKIILSTGSEIPGRYFCVNDAENFSLSVGKIYHNVLDSKEDIQLEDDVQRYYEEKTHYLSENAIGKKLRKPNMLTVRKRLGWRGCFRKPYVFFHYCMFCLRYGNNKYREAVFKNAIRKEQLYIPIIRAFSRHGKADMKYYNSLATIPNNEERFFLYLLQYTPEESTLPRAGIFNNQLLAIQLLAYVSSEVGLMVYVKEHFMQPYRDKRFYMDIKTIRNVKLIKRDISTIELMKSAIGVSTCTGTCILESVFLGRPIIAFGRGQVFKGLNSLFCVETYEECRNAIDRILSDDYQSDDIKKYLYAIQKGTYKLPDNKMESNKYFFYSLFKLVLEC